jgi:hypothetical protein
MWSWPSDPVCFDNTELYQNAIPSFQLMVIIGFVILGLCFAYSEIRLVTNPTARNEYRWSVFCIVSLNMG